MKTLAILLCFMAMPAMAQEALVRQLSVSGTAKESLKPDIMSVSVTATGRDMALSNAKQMHDDKLRGLLAVAKKFGIEGKSLSTQRGSIQPIWKWEKNTQVFKGYVVQTTLHMQYKQNDKAGAFLEALVLTQPERMNGPHYRLEETKPVQDRLRVAAIADAKMKAEAMAKEVGLTLGKPITMSDSWRMPPQPKMMRAEMAMMSRDASPAAPPTGEQEIAATVNIVYELKE
jgi:uncharacterized protein YggE